MKKKSEDDPILAELHKVRRQIMEECGNDPGKFHAMLKRAEAKYADRLVQRPKSSRKTAKRARAS